MKVLKFNKDDEMNEIELSCRSIKTLKSKLVEKTTERGFNELDCVYTWNLEDIEIKCYGYTEGDDSLKNNHNLPIDYDSKFNLYGCLFLVAFFNNKLKNLHISEYALLSYQQDMEQFDDSNDSNDSNDEFEMDQLDDSNNIDDSNSNSIKLNDNMDNSDQLELDTHTY